MPKGKTAQVLIALGANLPFAGQPPAATLAAALADLAREGFVIQSVSRLYATPCFPANAGPDYVNAAACLSVSAALDSDLFLQRLHAVEARFGRERQTRWGNRTLDIDLLAIGDSVLPDGATHDRWRDLPPKDQPQETPAKLILPHPRLQDRAFVLVPLADVAPDWVHPRLGRSVRQMLADLPDPDRQAVKPL